MWHLCPVKFNLNISMKTIVKLFFGAVCFLTANAMFAQNVVNGTVYDAETKEPLPGANITIKGTTRGVSSDIDGHFTLKTTQTKGTLFVSYVSFENKEVPFVIHNGKASVKVFLTPDAQSLGEVVVTTTLVDIAKDRQTPVAVSTIKSAEIVEKLAGKEFPEILNRTPSVYATKSGGGFGDSKINIRGFANENIAVMVNGMPTNDMENGRVYWSNWSGISDVTSAMQVQRGLGASKLAIASVGGTINIITNASDMKEGGVLSASYGNEGEYKGLAAYNTGKNEKGWSASVLLSRNWGQKYAEGTKFEGYNYYFALGYAPSEKHNFQIMLTGAPQWHHQRGSSVSIADAIKYGGSLEKPNRQYNSDWGYLNGEEYSMRLNAYHKPVATFNWDWAISKNSSLSTVLYASLGRGFGTGDQGSVDKKRLSAYRTEEGLYDFDKVQELNAASNADKGVIVRRLNHNSHDWYGFLTNFKTKINEKLSLSAGLDGRYYYGYHFQTLNDLLGAKSFKDTANKNIPANYVSQTFSSKPIYNIFAKSVPDLQHHILWSNNGEVKWMGVFAQLEYSNKDFSAFFQSSSSLQAFQRIDNFVKPGTLAIASKPETAMQTKTGFKSIPGYNVKGGANYNINEQHNIFANVGFYSKQPFFNAVFPNNKNFVNDKLTNEKIFGIEAGYGFKSNFATVHLNAYRTQWKDRNLVKSNDVSDGKGGTIRASANILGITEIHQGVEVEADFRITDYLNVKGAFSWGDWFYKGNAEGNLYNDANELIDSKGNVVANAADAGSVVLFLDDVKVGDSAQKTASVGVTVKPIKNLKFDADWRFVDNLYANLNVAQFSDKKIADKGALKLPSYNLFDLGLSYHFQLTEKQKLTLAAHVNNLFDTYYIAESFDNNHTKTLEDFGGNTTNFQNYQNTLYKGIDTSNRVYFGFGRSYHFSVRYNF